MSKSYNLLAIETATSACSVALFKAGEICHRDEIGNNIHSKSVLSMVQSVLQEAQLETTALSAVVVGQGPGSFTGLRIGIGVAQGIAYGVACPMIGISSLDGLALQSLNYPSVPSDAHIIATIDARMGEVYWAEYLAAEGRLTRTSELRLDKPQFVSASTKDNTANHPVILCGNAFKEYQGQFSEQLTERALLADSVIFPSAVSLIALSHAKFAAEDWVAAVDFVPEYVRNDVAKRSTKKPY